jgi:probable rRNA maturation factor
MKVYIRNRQRLLKANHLRIASQLRKALSLLGLHRAELSVLLVNDKRMRVLNRRYRGVDRTTDVLSFPQLSASHIRASRVTNHDFSLGDIVINLHKAKRQAAENGILFDEELKRLMIHGLLHLLGYDHERGGYAEKKMKKKSEELFHKLI